jgi:uncharacterized small protein (DUF1192 family)
MGSAMFDDDRPKPPKPAFVPGQDLGLLSIHDLHEAIALMKSEIARLEAAIALKEGTKASAESLFKF